MDRSGSCFCPHQQSYVCIRARRAGGSEQFCGARHEVTGHQGPGTSEITAPTARSGGRCVGHGPERPMPLVGDANYKLVVAGRCHDGQGFQTLLRTFRMSGSALAQGLWLCCRRWRAKRRRRTGFSCRSLLGRSGRGPKARKRCGRRDAPRDRASRGHASRDHASRDNSGKFRERRNLIGGLDTAGHVRWAPSVRQFLRVNDDTAYLRSHCGGGSSRRGLAPIARYRRSDGCHGAAPVRLLQPVPHARKPQGRRNPSRPIRSGAISSGLPRSRTACARTLS